MFKIQNPSSVFLLEKDNFQRMILFDLDDDDDEIVCIDSDDNGNTFRHLKSNQTISVSQALSGISETIVHEFIVFDSAKVWIPFKSQNLNRFRGVECGK